MVRDSEEDAENLPVVAGAAEEPLKTANALLKRAEQLKRWEESETNKEIVSANFAPRKVKFPEECVFLAACASGDIDEVQCLLNKGADINTANVDGLTALHQAVIDENLEMVQFLLSNGADVDAQDNEGWTPLMAGISCNFLDIVRYLLSKNADPVLHNNDGELPIDLAETDEMRLLLEAKIKEKGIDIEDARFSEERLMFEDAIAWSKSTKITKEHTHPTTGATPVHVAASKGYCKVLRILLQAGAEVNAKDKDGWTPLHAAAHWGEREACEILAEHNANFQEINNTGMTCVDVADPDLVEYLESLEEKQKVTQSLSRNVTRRPTTMPPTTNARTLVLEPQPTVVTVPPPISSPSVHLPSWRLTGRRAAGPIPTSMANLAPTPTVQQIPAAPVFRQVSSSSSVPNTPLESPPPIDPKTTPSNDPPVTIAKSVSSEIRKKTEALNNSPSTSFAAEDKSKNNVGANGQRAEESEAERKLRAKRERESRRSTQGVTLETVKAAEHFFKKSTDVSSNAATATNTNNVEKSFQSSSKNESNLPSAPPTPPTINRDSNEKRSSSSSSSSDEKSTTISSRLNANLTTALKNLDEFQNANNGPFGIVSKIVAKKNVVQDNKNAMNLHQTANNIHSKDRDKFSAKFIPGDEEGSASSNLSKIEKTATSSTVAPLIIATTAGDASSSSLSNSRAARRTRANRRSTGPIAQDDVHLALDEGEKVDEGNGEIMQIGAENSNKNKENNTKISTTNVDKHVTLRSNNVRSNGSMTDKQESNNTIRRPLTAKFESSDVKNGRTTNPLLPKPAFNYQNLSDYRTNRSPTYLANISSSTNGSGSNCNSASNAGAERFISRTSSGVSVSSSGGGQDMDIDYKKLYEKETVENERLRKIITDLEKSLENTKLTTKQASGDGCHIVPYNSRLEKLVADLEEENRTLEQIRADNIRLKEENGALIRVISKLSKTK